MRDRRKGTLGVTLVAMAALVVPAGAAASTRTASATLGGAVTFGSAVAKCPKHQRATGGGFLGPALGGPSFAHFFESRKVGQRSWRISAFSGGGTPTFTSYVYCSKHAPKTTEKSAVAPLVIGPVPGGTADASCSSSKAQAGGFALPNPYVDPGNSGYLLDSFRLGSKTWRSQALHSSGSPTIASYVYCAEQSAPKARTGSVLIAPTQVASATSSNCKKHTRVAAGGLQQPDMSTSGLFAFVSDSYRIGKAWHATGFHQGTATTLTAIAYCA
jgi:hypothetical protein